MSITLRELASLIETGGPELVVSRFGDAPVMVFLKASAPEEVDYGATMKFSRSNHEDTHSGESRSPWAALAQSDSVVVPLLKSERNPFAGVISVGRRADNDVVLLGAGISKLHALFRQTADGWSIKDSGSRNGTYLNHLRMDAHQELPLRSGDELKFCDTRGMFMQPEELATLCTYVRTRG